MSINKKAASISYRIGTGVLLGALSLSAQSQVWQGLELTGALGNSWYHSNNSTIQITTDEEDLNKVSSLPSNISFSVGVGTHLLPDLFQGQRAVTGLATQLNYYYGVSSVKGDVWGFSSPDVDNWTFRAPFSSSRLMLDLKPEFYRYKGVTPYGILGVGAAWTQMSYHEDPLSSDVALASAVTLNGHSNITVAYDLGVGLSTPLTSQLDIAVEYLYTSIGQLSPSNYFTSLQSMVRPPSFAVSSQNLMLRLNWKMDELVKMYQK